MKHFQDDEEYDSMKEYESSIMSHLKEKDTLNDYESNIFSHWKEDDNDTFNEPIIKHFQDD